MFFRWRVNRSKLQDPRFMGSLVQEKKIIIIWSTESKILEIKDFSLRSRMVQFYSFLTNTAGVGRGWAAFMKNTALSWSRHFIWVCEILEVGFDTKCVWWRETLATSKAEKKLLLTSVGAGVMHSPPLLQLLDQSCSSETRAEICCAQSTCVIQSVRKV